MSNPRNGVRNTRRGSFLVLSGTLAVAMTFPGSTIGQDLGSLPFRVPGQAADFSFGEGVAEEEVFSADLPYAFPGFTSQVIVVPEVSPVVISEVTEIASPEMNRPEDVEDDLPQVSEAVREAPAPPPLQTTDVPEVAPEVVAAPEPAPEEPAYAGFMTSDITAESFPGMRRAALAAASREDSQVAEMLNLVRVQIGGMFIQEAEYEIGRIKLRTDLSMNEEARLLDMEAAAYALSSAPETGTAHEDARQVWKTMSDLKNGARVSTEEIGAAAADLSRHSEWIAGAASPILFEGALRAGSPDLARNVLDAAVSGNVLSISEAGFMRGRLAEADGDQEAAFDHYAIAMESFDVPGVRARIAFADLVLSRNVPESLPGLRDVLVTGVTSWKNDDYARSLMARLAAVTEEIGDTAGALHVMSRIVAEFPGTPEADLAEVRMDVLFQVLSEKGASGEIDIEAYMTTIRNLAWRVSSGDGWTGARTVLADKLSESGLYQAAAAEYSGILSDIRGSDDPNPVLAESVTLKEARARIALGETARAEEILRAPFSGALDRNERERDALLAQVAKLSIEGRIPENATGIEEQSLQAARTAFLKNDYENAIRLYDSFAQSGKRLPREDSSRYTIARARTEAGPENSMTGASDVIDQEGSEGIIAAGTTLSSQPVDMAPLSTQKASEILGRASSTVDAAERILGRTPPETENVGSEPVQEPS